MNRRGFTIIETILMVALLAIIVGLASPSFWNFLNKYQVDAMREDLVQLIRLAQSKSMQSEQGSAYSIHFTTGPGGSFILYRGTDFASRNTDYDEVHALPSALSLSSTLPDADLSFTKTEGATTDTGTLTIAWPVGNLSKTIEVNEVGTIDRQ